MSVKGRDLLLWLFFSLSYISIAGTLAGLPVRPISFVALAAGLGILAYYPYVFKARKYSRKLGLKWVVLLPLFPFWARMLLRLSGGEVPGRWKRAFEVHVEVPAGTTPREFIKQLGIDLKLVAGNFPGCLFMWESHVPIPSLVRRLMREGWGFWEEGQWLVPRFPLTGRELRGKRVKRGAVVVPQGCSARLLEATLLDLEGRGFD